LDTEYINKILEIGKKEFCSPGERDYFSTKLPNVSDREIRDILRRDYKISTGHITRREFLTIDPKTNKQELSGEQTKTVSFLINFIKGCHLIEIEHGGFGSTTNVFNLFRPLIEMDTSKAIDLYNWIASHGGNYYIESGVSFIESKKREENAEKSRIAMLANDQKAHSDAVKRKQKNSDRHNKTSQKTKQLYDETVKKIEKLDNKELIELFNKDVNNPGWTSSRARHHVALYEEFIKRKIDFSAIGDGLGLSFRNKIELNGNRIEIIKN